MRRDRLEIITQFSSQTTPRSPEEAALCHMTLLLCAFYGSHQVKYGNQDQHVDCLSSHQLSALLKHAAILPAFIHRRASVCVGKPRQLKSFWVTGVLLSSWRCWSRYPHVTVLCLAEAHIAAFLMSGPDTFILKVIHHV